MVVDNLINKQSWQSFVYFAYQCLAEESFLLPGKIYIHMNLVLFLFVSCLHNFVCSATIKSIKIPSVSKGIGVCQYQISSNNYFWRYVFLLRTVEADTLNSKATKCKKEAILRKIIFRTNCYFTCPPWTRENSDFILRLSRDGRH